MNQRSKQFLLDLIPPVIARRFGKNNRIRWDGNYYSWEDAERESVGYDHKNILEKVKKATLRVKYGESAYERDSVNFDEIQYSWPLLAGLMWIAAQHRGELNIIDFGGSLGSTFFQNRKFFQTLSSVSWNIIEQPHFVDVGKKHFEDDTLRFYYDLESCLKDNPPSTILFSSAIQYTKDPYELLTTIKSFGFDFILFDRTSFISKGEDRLTVQSVPKKIYSASYPCWFFNEQMFCSFFQEDYDLIVEFDALADPLRIGNRAIGLYKGFVFKRREKHNS